MLFAVVICTIMAMSVNALSLTAVPAGIYGTLDCYCTQRNSNIYSKTTVTTNPDNAYLRVKYVFNTSTNTQTQSSSSSSRGVTLFEHNKDLSVYAPDARPIYVQYCGEVRGGSQSPSAYVTRTVGYSINTSLIGG